MPSCFKALKLSQIKSDFTAMVSHELRTPLATVKESIRLMSDGLTGGVSEEQKVCLEMTLRNVERLIRLVNDILDFSRFEQGKMKWNLKEHNLTQLIRETLESYRPLIIGKGLAINFVTDSEIPSLLFDADAITQVLSNLLGNAVKFTEKGEICVHAQRLASEVVISVRDTGCGIPENQMHKLFQPFEQIYNGAGRKPGGTGLGLMICKQIVGQHGGRIGVESQFGKGSTIFFSLPCKS